MANTNIINAVFGSGICAVTTSAFRANYGMVLRFSGIDLPTAFEVDFSNYDVAGHDSITAIGQNGEVQIPDDMWDSGLNIYAFVYLHPTDDSGVTVYTVTIPVLGRPNRTDETPTPHEQTVIEQAISALNNAVEQTAADVVAADASATAAAQSEANASVSERSAAASASAALASQNAAESAAQSATEQASASAESAQNAANSASQAAQSATSAQESAEQAEQAVQSIGDDVERAERAAATATEKATEASASAATASTKATQAEQSATAAAQSASSAASSAQNAASSATAAESSASAAEQAKQDAQDAQAAAEQAAESVSGLSEQIAQNTADIADLVQTKAGALIDTIGGSIASFVPDATIPTIKGLTVDIEPVQDLHGYDHPWPAGGTKNKMPNAIPKTETINGVTFKLDEYGVFTVTGTSTGIADCRFPIGFSFTILSGDPKPKFVINNTISNTHVLFKFFNDGSQVDSWSCSPLNRIAEYSGMQGKTCNSYSIYIESGETVNFTISPMIVENSVTDYTYISYSNICPISGWSAVGIEAAGINVWDEEWEVGGLNITTGNNILISRLRSKNYIPCVPSVSYFWNLPVNSGLAVCYYDVNKTFISGAWEYEMRAKETPSNARYMKFSTGDAYGTTYNNDISINYTSTDHAYHPYTGTTYTITLGQTVYGGTLDATAGTMTVDRVKVTKRWGDSQYQTVIGAVVRKEITLPSVAVYPPTTGKPQLSSIAPYKASYFEDSAHFYINGNSANQLIIFLPVGTPDTTEFEVSYQLATPIEIQLDPVTISTISGQTNNVWADAGDVTVEYAADLRTYIDNKIAAAVAALS